MKKISTIILGLGVILGAASCGKDSGATFDTSKNITLYTRDGESGTRDGFFTKIGIPEAKSSNTPLAKVTEATSNGDMILKVKNDEYGVGYISLSSLDGSDLKGLVYEGVQPNEENVLNSTYQLTRNFNYVIRDAFDDDNKKQVVEAFVGYLSTKDAKSTIIANGGIVNLNDNDKTWNEIKADYPICNSDNSAITVKFGGSTSVEKIAKALSAEFAAKCGNFVPEHNHTGSGDAFKYTQGAKKDDTAKLDIGFLSRELNENEAVAANTDGRICIDAIVAVVNKANPLNNVTASDLVNMYKGTYTTWSDLIK